MMGRVQNVLNDFRIRDQMQPELIEDWLRERLEWEFVAAENDALERAELQIGASMILSRRKEALKAIADRMETIASWISERDPRAESWMVQQDIVISLAAVAK